MYVNLKKQIRFKNVCVLKNALSKLLKRKRSMYIMIDPGDVFKPAFITVIDKVKTVNSFVGGGYLMCFLTG